MLVIAILYLLYWLLRHSPRMSSHRQLRGLLSPRNHASSPDRPYPIQHYSPVRSNSPGRNYNPRTVSSPTRKCVYPCCSRQGAVIKCTKCNRLVATHHAECFKFYVEEPGDRSLCYDCLLAANQQRLLEFSKDGLQYLASTQKCKCLLLCPFSERVERA